MAPGGPNYALGGIAPRPYSAPATRQGFLAIASTTVEDLTGRVPTTTREVLEAHRDELAGVAA